jgi:hypothetical protein
LRLEPILRPYKELMNTAMLRQLADGKQSTSEELFLQIDSYYDSIKLFAHSQINIRPYKQRFVTRFKALIKLAAEQARKDADIRKSEAAVPNDPPHDRYSHIAFAWITCDGLGEFRSEKEVMPAEGLTLARFDDWLLRKIIREAFEGLLNNRDLAYWDSQLVRIIISHFNLLVNVAENTLSESFRRILVDGAVRDYLQVNRYEGVLWLNKERLVRMVGAFKLVAQLLEDGERLLTSADISEIYENLQKILSAANSAGYQIEKMVALLEE